MRMTDKLVVAAAAVAAAMVVACGSSLTAPSSDSGTSGSRVRGQFVSSGSASGLTGWASSQYQGMTVHVQQDTSISTSVRSDGSFTLDGVPQGTVTLVFSMDLRVVGEITLRNVGDSDDIRILLKLTVSGTVVLVQEERQHGDNHSADDNSAGQQEMSLKLKPDEWRTDWAQGTNSGSGGVSVRARIEGGPFAQIDPNPSLIEMEGPDGVIQAASARLLSDHFEIKFRKRDVISIVSSVSPGESVTVTVRGRFLDGTSWSLTVRVKIVKEDDSSDDASSDGSGGS